MAEELVEVALELAAHVGGNDRRRRTGCRWLLVAILLAVLIGAVVIALNPSLIG